MFYVVTYDIPDDQRRQKIAKILEDFGDRVQYSVFEMELDKAERLVEMQSRLGYVVKKEEDSIRIYFLCKECSTKVKIIGLGKLYQDEKVYIV